MKNLRILAITIFLLPYLFTRYPLPALASQKQEVYISGTVEPFGDYTVSDTVVFTLTKPGTTEIGTIMVDGIYNGEYPWIMRVYTDNIHFKGVAGVGQRPNPAGLISKDGRFVLPIQISTPEFGQDVWRFVPDVNQPGYRPYQPIPVKGTADYSDCVLMGIDPRNAVWVSGPDGVLYTEDDNLLGDITTKTPFPQESGEHAT